MAERLSLPGTHRQPKRKQTRAEGQAVYDYVTARDKDCRAPFVGPCCGDIWPCEGRLERHHAGNTIGSKRLTDPRHVILLCEFHHRTWAPSHSREILAYLERIEDERTHA